MTNLSYLILYNTSVDDVALQPLAENSTLPQLNLGSTKLTDESIATFISMRGLKALEIRGTSISNEAFTELARARPELEIDR